MAALVIDKKIMKQIAKEMEDYIEEHGDCKPEIHELMNAFREILEPMKMIHIMAEIALEDNQLTAFIDHFAIAHMIGYLYAVKMMEQIKQAKVIN